MLVRLMSEEGKKWKENSMYFITFLVVLTYFSPKKYAIAGNIYGMLEEKIK